MDKTKIIIFAISLIAIGAIQGQDGIAWESDEYALRFDCPAAGFYCNGCNESYFCFQSENGSLEAQLVEDCVLNQKTCDQATGTCTTGANLVCNRNITDYEFECHQPGVFPHPYTCNKYFICTAKGAEVPEEHECSPGFAYNPISNLCNRRIVNNKCDLQIKPCESAGENGLVPGHSSMYYICLQKTVEILSPQIFLCTDDEVYVGRACVKPSTGLNNDGLCITNGNFYKPDTCLEYNECVAGEAPESTPCPIGTKFSPSTSKCEEISC